MAVFESLIALQAARVRELQARLNQSQTRLAALRQRLGRLEATIQSEIEGAAQFQTGSASVILQNSYFNWLARTRRTHQLWSRQIEGVQAECDRLQENLRLEFKQKKVYERLDRLARQRQHQLVLSQDVQDQDEHNLRAHHFR